MIHDRGKNDSTPEPNSHDLQGIRMAHGTNSVNYTTDASSTPGGPPILAGNLRLVQSNTATVNSDGVHNTSTTTIPHNLGYFPFLTWSMNHLSTSTLTGVNLMAPQALTFTMDNTAHTITFSIMVWCAVDANNVYIQLFDTSGLSHSYDITYYLYQQESGV